MLVDWNCIPQTVDETECVAEEIYEFSELKHVHMMMVNHIKVLWYIGKCATYRLFIVHLCICKVIMRFISYIKTCNFI